MAEETYTITQEEKDMLDYFKKNHFDKYEMYCDLLEYYNKEQLASMLIEKMEENNFFERKIKLGLKK